MDFKFKCPECGREIISDRPENPVCLECFINRNENIKMERVFEPHTEMNESWKRYKRRQFIK